MEIGSRIKAHRARLGLSQEALAQRIFVSRQTLSSWENDKTYPDVHSLLLLSNVFDATVDSLVKGDLETMEHAVVNDCKTMNRLSWLMLALTVATVAAALWGGYQYLHGWGSHTIPTWMLTGVLWMGSLASAQAVENLKKRHDLVTYQEILAFSKNLPIDRDNEKSRRARQANKTERAVGILARVLFGAGIGAAIGYGGMWILDHLGS